MSKPKIKPRLHVVAGVLENPQGEICIAQRHAQAHQAGLWEFPGGKCEADETAFMALQREFTEELDVHVTQARPLISIQHDYSDKPILLDVWKIQSWQGQAWGKEGQPVRWVAKTELRQFPFPLANQAIIRAIELPESYLITPEPKDFAEFLVTLEESLQAGVRLVQLRAKQLEIEVYLELAQRAAKLCHQHDARLLLTAAAIEPQQVESLGADGLHLTSQDLHHFANRPIAADLWLAASCHNLADIQQARRINADFLVLSPVARTQSHPDAQPLGWETFAQWTRQAHCPVYALGGMRPEHIQQAQTNGGQGIAAMRGLWK